MDFVIDLDPIHSIIRLTVVSPIVNLSGAEQCFVHLRKVSSRGGPYAGIYDLSAVTGTTLTVALIRQYARRIPSIPIGRPHVIVGTDANIFELARIFQMCREFRVGQHFDVVRTMQVAYKIVGAHPEDFTQHLYPKELAA